MSAQTIYEHGDPSLYCMACDHYHDPAEGCAMFDESKRGFVIDTGTAPLNRGEADLADAVAAGAELTEVDRLRVVLALKDAQIDRLADRIGRAIVAAQDGEPSPTLISILRGERPTDRTNRSEETR